MITRARLRTPTRGLLLALACAAAPFALACGGGDAMSEEECAAYGYQTFVRERAESAGNCGELPAVAAAVFDENGTAACEGGFQTNVCSYKWSWDCPGDDGQVITYEGIVSWSAKERGGFGGSAVTVKDKDGNVVCQSSYDEAWAGDEPADPSEPPKSESSL